MKTLLYMTYQLFLVVLGILISWGFLLSLIKGICVLFKFFF